MITVDRRRVLNTPYVNDGLVFHLDGWNKGGNDGIWTDLVGGRQFTNGGAAVFETNGVRFTGSATSYLDGATIPTSWSASTYTIEVCYTTNMTEKYVLFKSRTGGVALVMTSRLTGRIGSSESDSVKGFTNRLLSSSTVSYTTAYAMQGLVEMTSTTSGYLNLGNGTQIGARRKSATATNTDYRLTGKIYSIRIYNRRLSLEEMKHNQRIDNKRFNLGLNF
jgi:hypothetical protein